MHSLLILPGDGIGPEVMTEVRRIIAWFQDKKHLKKSYHATNYHTYNHHIPHYNTEHLEKIHLI